MKWRQKGIEPDPPRDVEIAGWFQALGPPPSRQASPYLRAHVRARIEEDRARRGGWAWGSWLSQPLWVSGLLTGILLAVSVWWGLGGFMAFPSSTQEVSAPFRVYEFQRQAQQLQAVGQGAAVPAPATELLIGRGFMAAESGIMFFRLGTLYADALATLLRGTVEQAAPHLHILARGLERLQAPLSLLAHVREMHRLVQQQSYSGEVIARLLALFDILYEAEYRLQGNPIAITLFQAGVWTENLSLAAAIANTAALQQGQREVVRLHQALQPLHIPPAALAALAQLRQVMAQHPLTEVDLQAISVHLQVIQQHLGALDAKRRWQP